MSITDETPVVRAQGEPGSLRDALLKRKRQLAESRSRIITIPVNGYEDVLAASYRRLDAEEAGDILFRHPKYAEDAHDTVGLAVDSLLAANTDLLRVTGKDQYESLGQTWTAGWIVANLFETDAPEGITTRNAMLAAFDSGDLSVHYRAYQDAVNKLDEIDAEALPGESEPSAEG